MPHFFRSPRLHLPNRPNMFPFGCSSSKLYPTRDTSYLAYCSRSFVISRRLRDQGGHRRAVFRSMPLPTPLPMLISNMFLSKTQLFVECCLPALCLCLYSCACVRYSMIVGVCVRAKSRRWLRVVVGFYPSFLPSSSEILSYVTHTARWRKVSSFLPSHYLPICERGTRTTWRGAGVSPIK